MAKNSMRGARGSTGPHKAEAAGSTPAPAISTLSAKQRLCVLKSLEPGETAASAYRAVYGCSPATAETNGPRLLRTAQAQALVQQKLSKVEERTELSIEKLDRSLQAIIDFDLRRCYRPMLKDGQPVLDGEGRPRYELIPLPEWPEDLAKSLAGCDVEELFEGASGERFQIGQVKKWKLWDKVRAHELAYKRRGALVDKAEVDVKGITQVTVRIGIKKKGQGT